MSETKETRPSVSLGARDLETLSQPALRRTQQTIEFAGFLTREDDDAVYIADAQGTWVIRRDDLVFLEDWQKAQTCAPEFMRSSGKPVRVGVREGATVQEIRPWLMRRGRPVGGDELRQSVEGIFTLGGAPLPIGEKTIQGELQVAELGRMFARRLGWSPDCNEPYANPRVRMPPVSQTIVIYDGY